jgi:hypothetical protein
MTPEEHQLVVNMLAKQFHYIELLIRILHNKELLKDDDLPALLYVSRADEQRNAQLLRVVKGEYMKSAKEIGLKVTFPREKRKLIS